MSRSFAAGSLLAILAVAGCQSSPAYKSYSNELGNWDWGRRVATVFKDTVLDLTDIVQVDGSAGEGFLVNARVTKIAQVGFGHFAGRKGGWNQRSLGFWKERRTEGGASVLYYTDAEVTPVYGTTTLFDRGYQIEDWTVLHNEDHHWLDVGASAHVLFLGADVNVSPKEALDFLVGLGNIPFTIIPVYQILGMDNMDLANDDTAAALRKKHEVGYIEQPHGLNISATDPASK